MMRRETVVLFVGLFVLAGSCAGLTIDHYGNWEVVSCLSHRDGVTAIGTWGGIVILRDEEEIIRIGMNEGLPGGDISDIQVADSETIYLMISYPFYLEMPVFSEWNRLFRLDLRPDGFSFANITPEFDLWAFSWPRGIDLGPDGSLWIVGFDGLWVYDGTDWMLFSWPGAQSGYSWGALCVDSRGRAWIALVDPDVEGLYYLEDGEWQIADGISDACAVAEDASGRVWCVTHDSLWVREGENWTLASEDPAWRDNFVLGVFPDQEGGIWAMAKFGILHWHDGHVDVISEAAGVDFDRGGGWFVSDGTSSGSGAIYFGTKGSGLLVFRDGGFIRLQDETCLPSIRLSSVLEDRDGGIFCMTNNTDRDEAAIIRNAIVNRMHWPYSTYSTACYDLNGALWFVQTGLGPMTYMEGEFKEYDFIPDYPAACTDWRMAIDRSGTKWFTLDSGEGALEFDGKSWTRYRGDSPNSDTLLDVVVGPDDVKWFAGIFHIITYDNEIWHANDAFVSFPTVLNFDIDGNLVIAGGSSVSKYVSGTGWIDILRTEDGRDITCLEVDADGRLWCGTSEGLYYQDGSDWRKMTTLSGLSRDDVYSLCIDHNGDKWIGSTCLDQVQDGGAAQQKVEISTGNSSEAELVLEATFTNTGPVIPVLLWLACEYEDSLYFYPDWGPSPTPTALVLGAHTTETCELLRMDPATLPAGEYTFIGGMSLTGGIHLMIGPRHDKLAFATYEAAASSRQITANESQ